MTKKYDAVFFDLDGTLMDTAPDIIAACNYTLKKYNLKEQEYEKLLKVVTAGMREMLYHSIPKDIVHNYDVEHEMRECFASYYVDNINTYTKPFKGIESLCKKLHDNDIKVAIITNKYIDMANKLMSKFDFAKNIELILGCDSCTHYKPHPEPILKAMEHFKVNSDRTIYVGDHLNDIKAANAANCTSCTALWGYGINECIDVNLWNADLMAKDVDELQSFIFY